MIKEYELIVRKRISSFIEKILRVCNYDFRHDIYKQVIYGEIPYKTELEEKFKNYYDSFMFLLHNKQSPFTEKLLTKFLMLFDNLTIKDEQKLRIVSKMFYLDGNNTLKDAVDFHMFIYEEFYESDESQRLLISLMFFNYILVRNNIPCIQIVKSQFTQYFEYRDDYLNDNEQNLYCFFEEILSKSKFQEKEFKENLKEISVSDICNKFLEDKELLQNKFNLKNIYIFGSFAKGIARIDSDIDIMILFDENILYQDKTKVIDTLKEKYEKYFHRYIDFSEVNKYLTEEIIKEQTKIIKIF